MERSRLEEEKVGGTRSGPEFGADDLETTQGFLLRANAGAFETLGAKLNVLRSMSAHGFPADYVLQREDIVREMSVPEIQRLSRDYLDVEGMIWRVVGDAATQRDRLQALGLGEATLLDREGNPVG